MAASVSLYWTLLPANARGIAAMERFPMCSTFKFLLASAVLKRVDRHQETLDHSITIPAKPLLPNSPLTEPHAGGTMTIAALCHAALTRSDNTAANLLLESIGGPAGITRFSRSNRRYRNASRSNRDITE